ncbi:TPA: diguanylate cyclase [Serratia liquefaciens]|uniref:sensor domain-containing diguanylate cyclase n=1 Tax=Serratia liquefaciens TaxID=614 RepID=UPI001020E7B2|nr:GGDEF domain-containing protein [Serratia liquefaciens]MDU4173383.1 diguanylate cyclase [Serratia liquefaciens]RYM74230.1 diguanylate cyclase [Serratia liquefaciens]
MTQQQPQDAERPRNGKNSPLLFQAGVFVVIVAVTLILFNGWQIWNAHQRDLQSAENESANLARSLAQHADDTFMQTDTTLSDLTERIQTDGLGQPQQLRLQKVMQTQVGNLPQLHGLFVYDAQGNWIVTSSGRFIQNANNADREYFKFHLSHNSNAIFIGKVVRSRSTGDLIIPVSRRINNPDGSFNGVVLATLYVDYFRQFYDTFALNSDASLNLLLADGTILYRRPYSIAAIGKNISEGVLFREILPHSEFGNATITSRYDKVERIYGYSRVNRYPLVIAAGLSKEDALSDWRNDTGVFALGGATLLIILLAMGLVLMRQINHSIRTEAELMRTRDQLTTINRTLEELALLDGLTGLANRRQFDIAMKNELMRASRNYRSVALLMLDIDCFKQYNDIYGHVAGDQCLQQIGQTLKGLACRSNDIMARYGGEEMAIILPDTDTQGALIFAERVIESVRELKIPHTGNPHGIVTISIGIFAKVPHMYNDTPIGFINQADSALYQAKAQGKNRIYPA